MDRCRGGAALVSFALIGFLLMGCGQAVWGGSTAVSTPLAGASPATPPVRQVTLFVANPSRSPQPWSASPAPATVLTVTPTPIACPSPYPDSATPKPPNWEPSICELAAVSVISPVAVIAVVFDGAIEVQWLASGGVGRGYEIFRQVVPQGEWTSMATVAADTAHGSAAPYAWRDTTTVTGVTYRYTVSQVSDYGIQSRNTRASFPVIAP